MKEARKLTDILDIEDNDLIYDSLDCFIPDERWAVELFIVYCSGSNMVAINNDDILKPSEITLELIIKIMEMHYSDVFGVGSEVEPFAKSIFKSFQRMFVNKE